MKVKIGTNNDKANAFYETSDADTDEVTRE